MSDEAAVVFTAKSVERILRDGGTSSWRLDRNHARQCAFAVCTRNANAEWVEGPEATRPFWWAQGCMPSPEPGYEKRYLIRFSEYAARRSRMEILHRPSPLDVLLQNPLEGV